MAQSALDWLSVPANKADVNQSGLLCRRNFRSSDALPQRDSAGVRAGAAHGLTSSILDKRRQTKPGRPSTPQSSSKRWAG